MAYRRIIGPIACSEQILLNRFWVDRYLRLKFKPSSGNSQVNLRTITTSVTKRTFQKKFFWLVDHHPGIPFFIWVLDWAPDAVIKPSLSNRLPISCQMPLCWSPIHSTRLEGFFSDSIRCIVFDAFLEVF